MGSFENENLKTKHPNLENDALKTRKRSTQNSKARHPNLENEAPKTRKRSTQISKTEHPNLENEASKSRKRSTQISKTKHRKLDNGAPKSRKRSTQNSDAKHPKLETCLSYQDTRQSLVKSPAACDSRIVHHVVFEFPVTVSYTLRLVACVSSVMMLFKLITSLSSAYF